MVESSDFPRRSSFVVLINDGDFVDKLKIPSRALKKQGKSSTIITLRATHIPLSKWRVSVERRLGGLFFSGDGWNAFALYVDLKLGEYLWFNGTGESEFVVSIYQITGCKRETTRSGFAGNSPTIAISVSSEDEDDDDDDGDDDEGFSFVKKMTEYCIGRRLDIPRSCVNEAGIKRTMNIHLKNTNGSRRLWPVTLTYTTKRPCSLSSGGWRRFVRENDVNVGDTVRFTFRAGENVMEVRVLKTADEEEE